MSLSAPSLSDIYDAAARIAPYAHHTPVLQSRSLNAMAGCELFFKCENFQRVAAFKFRGACNAVFALSNVQAARGVVTQSSGNHGAAIALACRLRGIPATVVMPHTAPRIKHAAIIDFGAKIIECETNQADRDRVTTQVIEQTGAVLIHPFNDPQVIAGQATATLELLNQCDRLDAIITPVSGGGLLSGTCLAAHAIDPAIRLYGAEPTGANDAHDSLVSGERITGRHADTICDGLRAELGTLTFAILREHLQKIILIDDEKTLAALQLIIDRLKIIVEPSCAIALAAIFAEPGTFSRQKVGIILSGGNIDLDIRSGLGL